MKAPLANFSFGFVSAVVICLAASLFGYQHLTSQPPPQVPESFEAIVYLPVADAKGKRLSDEEFQEAIKPIIASFGGATLNTEQTGFWMGAEGKVAREPVRPLMVTFRRDKLPQFRKDVEEVGRRLKQESVYFQLQERKVELIEVREARKS